MTRRALVRSVPASFAQALAATPPEHPIDVLRARRQHAAYVEALVACGLTIETLAADEALPDCVFIEDTAVIVGGLALITNPGAPTRRAEVHAVARALEDHVELAMMSPAAPLDARVVATLDGGDCMRVGKTIYVGRSARTNAEGIARLGQVFRARGFEVVALDLPAGVLHLKCVCSPLDDDRILLAEGSLPASAFAAQAVIVPAAEAYAANAVAIGTHVIAAAEFPLTLELLAKAGFTVHPVETSEVRKADGALTCQSLLL